MTKKRKPKKRYSDFPLFLRANRQWAKKIRGKLHYFGTDFEAVLNKYLEQKDDLQAGRIPRTKEGRLTVRRLVNLFLTSQKTALELGRISLRSWNDHYGSGVHLAKFFGDALVEDLRPEDFNRYLAKLAKTRKLVAVSNSILRVRIIFNWAFLNDHIERPVRFGSDFKQPSKTALRRTKTTGKKFAVADLRKILKAANHPPKAMIFLGINCAYGQSDGYVLLRDWEVIGRLNRVLSESDPRRFRVQSAVDPVTIQADVDAARSWLATRVEELDLPFRVPELSIVCLLLLGERLNSGSEDKETDEDE